MPRPRAALCLMTFSALNRLCDIRDFKDPRRIAAIRELEPEFLQSWPGYPAGMEHRKSWEYAQLIVGLEVLNAVNRRSLVLAVSPGADRPTFALTRRARLVFAAGLYAGTPHAAMLSEPEMLARCTFDRNRLIVQHMEAANLRYEDETFDVVYQLGAAGGLSSILPRFSEMVRVCRNGGIVMLTVECAVNGAAPAGGPLTPEEVRTLLASHPAVEPVQPIDWTASPDTFQQVRSLDRVIADLNRGHTDYPHIAFEQQGCHFTSLSLFMRKGGSDA